MFNLFPIMEKFHSALTQAFASYEYPLLMTIAIAQSEYSAPKISAITPIARGICTIVGRSSINSTVDSPKKTLPTFDQRRSGTPTAQLRHIKSME
jgi:hypothetical protein